MRRVVPRRCDVLMLASRASSLFAISLLAAACREQPTLTEPAVSEVPLLAQATASLLVTPANDTILVGENLNLSVRNANGSAINKQAVWTSSDTSVATVISTGTATARVTGRKPGVVTINVTSGPKSGSQTTSVRPVPVRSVDVTPSVATVELGDTVQYSAIARDSAGNPLSGRVVTWHSTTPGIAAVNATGRAITTGRGSTGIAATIEGVSDTASLFGTQTPFRMELVNRSLVFSALGDTTRLIANVYDRLNNLIADATVTWASDNPAIATVDATGLVTPRYTGVQAWTFVHASIQSLADTATVLVYRNPTSFEVSPDTIVVNELTPIGQASSHRFTSRAFDPNGYVVEGVHVLWESLNPGVALVIDSGYVVALSNGHARIHVFTFNGIGDTVDVIVDAPPPVPDVIEAIEPSGAPSDDMHVASLATPLAWSTSNRVRRRR